MNARRRDCLSVCDCLTSCDLICLLSIHIYLFSLSLLYIYYMHRYISVQMLNKDTEQQVEEIKRLKEKEERLIETIRSLEKDIQSHKKEIR